MPCTRVCKSPVPPRLPSCPRCAVPFPPKYPSYVFPEILRKIWEAWDLRILILYILFTQLYLHVFGCHRKSSNRTLIKLNVWLLYLFSDLLATISLGKLSDVAPLSLLRSLWAPIILFYLGGPDTITVLNFEENQLWLRHLIALLTQGLRTTYVLYLTWTTSWISVLALLMLFSGLIKYGERVWVIKSRARANSKGFIQFDIILLEELIKSNIAIANASHDTDLVLQAYLYFQTLKPHDPNHKCNKSKLDNLIKKVTSGTSTSTTTDIDPFKLIEIELGFMYDVFYSKLDTIFTVWGCILRFISFSCLVSVFVGFFLVEKPSGYMKNDLSITIVLLVGALFLEIGGIIVQLGSDWALVWACKQYPSKFVTPIFYLHKLVNYKSKRWSELMGQFSLLNYSKKYRPTMFNQIVEDLGGKEKMLKMRFGSPVSRVQPIMKELIINHLREISPSNLENETMQDSTMKRGECALRRKRCLDAFKWSIELEFGESIVIWHVATDICYHSEDPNLVRKEKDPNLVRKEKEAAKILSYYMMHLLFIYPDIFSINDTNDKLMQACRDVKKSFEGGSISSEIPEACKQLLEKQCNPNNTTMKIQELARKLMMQEDKWQIMSDVWVEMLCFAASHCPLKHHVRELRHGGEFLTHVWLLLMHFGVTKRAEESGPQEDANKAEIIYEGVNEAVSNL